MEETLTKRGYTQKQASLLAKELKDIDERLKPALDNWMRDETETDFMAEGFTVLGLKQQYNMTYPAALISIDWVLKDPENAVKCIEKGLR